MRRVPRTFGIRRTVGWTALRGARSSGAWSPDRTSWSVSQEFWKICTFFFKEQGFCLDLTMFVKLLGHYRSKFGVSNKYNVLDYQISILNQIKKERKYHGFPKNIRQNKCFQHWLIRRNVSWAANQHIRMISEGSCDTEDWSNDVEYSALRHRNKLHFNIYIQIENIVFKL